MAKPVKPAASSSASSTAAPRSPSPAKQPSKKSSAASSSSVSALIEKALSSYNETPSIYKIIDAYLVFVMLTGIIQFVYVFIVGTYPYNAFLAGFIASVGSFVLTANLRIQTNPKNRSEFNISPERAFTDYVFCSLVLYGFVFNYLG
ncbi:DAD family-domain-containing protein [Cladochytrium replicatum]|nr:DAD family-domain-containing protein [Cladochytrium replicatum]